MIEALCSVNFLEYTTQVKSTRPRRRRRRPIKVSTIVQANLFS